MKTLEELKKLDATKLNEELKEAQKELAKTNFEIKNGQSKNSHAIRSDRKQIARIKTIINSSK